MSADRCLQRVLLGGVQGGLDRKGPRGQWPGGGQISVCLREEGHRQSGVELARTLVAQGQAGALDMAHAPTRGRAQTATIGAYWRGHRQRNRFLCRFSDLILGSYHALDFHLSNYKLMSTDPLDNPVCGVARVPAILMAL